MDVWIDEWKYRSTDQSLEVVADCRRPRHHELDGVYARDESQDHQHQRYHDPLSLHAANRALPSGEVRVPLAGHRREPLLSDELGSLHLLILEPNHAPLQRRGLLHPLPVL